MSILEDLSSLASCALRDRRNRNCLGFVSVCRAALTARCMELASSEAALRAAAGQARPVKLAVGG